MHLFLMLLATTAFTSHQGQRIDVTVWTGEHGNNPVDTATSPTVRLDTARTFELRVRSSHSMNRTAIVSCSDDGRCRTVWPIDQFSAMNAAKMLWFNADDLMPHPDCSSFTLVFLRIPEKSDPVEWINSQILTHTDSYLPRPFASRRYFGRQVRQFFKFDVAGTIKVSSLPIDRLAKSRLAARQATQLLVRAHIQAQSTNFASCIKNTTLACQEILGAYPIEMYPHSHPVVPSFLVQAANMCILAGDLDAGERINQQALDQLRLVFEFRPSYEELLIRARHQRNLARLYYHRGDYRQTLRACDRCRSFLGEFPPDVYSSRLRDTTGLIFMLQLSALTQANFDADYTALWAAVYEHAQDDMLDPRLRERLTIRTLDRWGYWLYSRGEFSKALEKAQHAKLVLGRSTKQTREELALSLSCSILAAKSDRRLGKYRESVQMLDAAIIEAHRLQTPDAYLLLSMYTEIAHVAIEMSNPAILKPHLLGAGLSLRSIRPIGEQQCSDVIYASVAIADAAAYLQLDFDGPSTIRRAIEVAADPILQSAPDLVAMAYFHLALIEFREGRTAQAEAATVMLTRTTKSPFLSKRAIVRSLTQAISDTSKGLAIIRDCINHPKFKSEDTHERLLVFRTGRKLAAICQSDQEAVDYGQQAYDLYMEHLKDLASETNSAEFHRKRQAARIILNDLLADGIVARTNPATLAKAVRRFYQTDFAVRVAGEDQHQQLMLRRADLELVWQTTLLQSVLPNIGVKQTQETLKEIAQLERGTLFIPSVPPGDLATPDRPAWLLHRMPHGDLDWLLLFHPTADGGTRLAVIDAGPFMEKLQSWRRKTIDHQDADEDLQWLSRQLQSVFPQLPTKISITGDPLVYEIPWAALWVDERRLIERAAIEVAERPQAGDPTIELTRSSLACLIGDVHFPDNATLMRLPFSGKEVTQVARYFDKPQLGLKRVPNRSWVLEQLTTADIAHFATHGIGRSTVRNLGQGDSPLLAKAPFLGSGLLIASESSQQADLLTAATVSQLHLPQLKLVVLSACESAVGAGDEPGFALPRAFHLAGAQTVVSTQWPVDDQATSVLMKLFYANLLDEKMQPAEAVRQAQLTVYHHPQQLSRLAQMRGPDFSKAAQKLRRVKTTDGNEPRASPRLWAGFLVSRRR